MLGSGGSVFSPDGVKVSAVATFHRCFSKVELSGWINSSVFVTLGSADPLTIDVREAECLQMTPYVFCLLLSQGHLNPSIPMFTLNNLKVSVRFFFFKTRFGTNVIR